MCTDRRDLDHNIPTKIYMMFSTGDSEPHYFLVVVKLWPQTTPDGIRHKCYLKNLKGKSRDVFGKVILKLL